MLTELSAHAPWPGLPRLLDRAAAAHVHPRFQSMLSRSFLKSGHTPTLFAAFLYFDFSFMVWVLLGPLGGSRPISGLVGSSKKASTLPLPASRKMCM